jgi:TldD protein
VTSQERRPLSGEDQQAANLARAREVVFGLGGLTDNAIRVALSMMQEHRIDDGELFFQTIKQESWALEDGAVVAGTFKLDQGVGVRAVSGERTAYAYSQDVTAAALLDAARAVRTITAAGQAGRIRVPVRGGARVRPSLYDPVDPATTTTADDRVALLQSVDSAARDVDPRIVSVSATLGINFEVIYIAGVDGAHAADIRPLVRLQVQVVVDAGEGRYEVGKSDIGGRYSLSDLDPQAAGRQAAMAALECIDARTVAAGEMPVVLAAGWPGILVHEAVGHGLEGDHVRKGMSMFKGLVGKRVASKGVSIVDSGTVPYNRGSLAIDDEGSPTNETVLVEDGILRGFMQDRLSARLSKSTRSANARRQTYAHAPLPRMTNTFMLPGRFTRDEVLGSLKRGLYVTKLDNGQVDIASGNFVFTTGQAYWVERGRIVHPVMNITLAGSGLATLKRISMVANDLQFDTGGGVCSKQEQHLPVSVGQPTIRVDSMVVGGVN